MSREEKLFNDCVHGHFTLPPLCVAIIDTEVFQRLRNIKQLGLSYYVYPAAAHNRFEHSLGVCHLAGEMVDSLNSNHLESGIKISPLEKLCLQVAGLCHDLGHGPFSHNWEDFLSAVNGENSWKHEEMSVLLFDEVLKSERVKKELNDSGLGEKHKELIKNIIRGKKEEARDRDFLFEIICNNETGIDVDKWDYLLRDGKQLNINITFDPHRLMKCLRICEVQKKYHICYRKKEMKTIFQMYMMRAELHRMAYQHPVVKMIDEMWIDALKEADRENYQFGGKKLSEAHKEPSVFCLLTDHIIQDILCSKNKKYLKARKLLERIHTRNLYKVIHRTTLTSREELAKIVELTGEQNGSDLFVTHLDLKMPDLGKSVLLYDKNNFSKAEPVHDWSSVPVFPYDMTQMKRVEVFFFHKNSESSSDILLPIIKNLLNQCLKPCN